MLARNYTVKYLSSEKPINAEQCHTVPEKYKKQYLAWPQGSFPLQQWRPHLGTSQLMAGRTVCGSWTVGSGCAMQAPSIAQTTVTVNREEWVGFFAWVGQV